ncbi:hypothetical protein [Corallococcus exiguus]|uniref:Lipoprotein n=1 Tax=Corallococcus exiguus TaxID=83462 RepID=A0A7X4YHW8_9BACT|nr:hypothetical protein [Corallococcus exiguus]NBC45726.1 hypothetical protein [Corallococcus exiguus]TNV54448.1 hypothetical protein FH620_33150 [Corallococcus exiguus]
MNATAKLCAAVALLTACAGGSSRRSAHGDLGFVDTETAAKLRHAAWVAEQGASSTTASALVKAAPVIIGLMQRHHSADELEERLAECAVQAERQGNACFFQNRPPTRQECREVVGRDRCGNPITRAMQLGKQKHVLVLQCAEEVLKELWAAPYSIEQRYRYYPNAKFVETISREKEARMLAEGCTDELRGTIKPDLVLHADRNLLESALTLDFKFPCPETNEPQWTVYGEGSPYKGQTQELVYEDALGGDALLISPKKGVVDRP